jgi:hypothetical protein
MALCWNYFITGRVDISDQRGKKYYDSLKMLS